MTTLKTCYCGVSLKEILAVHFIYLRNFNSSIIFLRIKIILRPLRIRLFSDHTWSGMELGGACENACYCNVQYILSLFDILEYNLLNIFYIVQNIDRILMALFKVYDRV